MISMLFFFSSRRRHTRFDCDWSSDVCSSDLERDGVPTERSGVARFSLPTWRGSGERGTSGLWRSPVGRRRSASRGEREDRKSVVEGKSVDLGGRRIIKKKKESNMMKKYCAVN